MKKSSKLTLLAAMLSVATVAWAADLTAATSNLTYSSTGVSTDNITHANLQEPVTVKLSKGVRGAYDFSAGGGLVGVATGHPNGRGRIFPNGTSATPGDLAVISTTPAQVTDATVLAAATAAMT